jgi:hypothetical protein
VPKSDLPIGPEYAPVADRIALFYERFPTGRIVTHLTMHNEREVMFRATVYRDERSRWPAATGWASERIGDGEINTVACLENTETSAIGRALANLGFTASKNRPSAEEMAKAARMRSGEYDATEAPRPSLVRESVAFYSESDQLQQVADEISDTLRLLDVARRFGFPSGRAEVIASALRRAGGHDERIHRTARRLRHWIAARRRKSWSDGELPRDGRVDAR